MKKAKRFLALLLGCLMLLGCISVSAANESLTVTERRAKMIYENDFSGDTVDTDHIELGAIASQSHGAIRTNNQSGHAATFYAAKDGIVDPVTFEFDIYENNMKDVGGAQVQMFFLNKAGSIVGDLRWYNANPKYFKIIQPSGSSAPAVIFNKDNQSAHIKAKLNPHTNSFAVWINGTEILSEANGSNGYAKVADFSEITGVKINVSAANMLLVLSNLKIYTEESNTLPSVWEEVYHADFEKNVDTFAATSNEIVPELNSNVSYTHKNGALTMKTTSTSGAGTKVYLQPNREALTGKYVVEMVLKNSSQTTANNGYHRITFGNLSSYYLQWLPTKVLKFRIIGSEYADLTSQMANYKANGDTLKVTLCYDTEAYKVTGYFNDIFAFEKIYEDENKVERTSYSYINFNLYTGQIDLADLRVYRPLEIDSTIGLKIEEKDNQVKFATANEKTGNIYFAKYDSDAENGKTLESLGVAPLNLVPGKIYTVDKTDWAGAKAFFWDGNLTPIVDSWNLAD